MNGSGKPGVTPQHVLQSAPGIWRSVSAGLLGEEVRRGKSGCRQEKRDEELFRHDRRVINRRILQAALVDLPANDQSKQRNGLDSSRGWWERGCVCVCLGFLPWLLYYPLPRCYCRSQLWPFYRSSPSGSYIGDSYRRRKGKSVTAPAKTSPCGCAACRGAPLFCCCRVFLFFFCTPVQFWIADWYPRLRARGFVFFFPFTVEKE